MAGTVTHLAIADKIYDILGSDVIKNLPLFFGGNIAPDAIHAKKDYQRADKKRSHLRDGISYGYGYPEIAELFRDRIDKFIENYYLFADKDKDLYLGYIVHIITDELYYFEYCKVLEQQLGIVESKMDASKFRRNLADKIMNNEYNSFFSDILKVYDILPHEYKFKQNVADVLSAVWDYEVKDYIGTDEINASKRWVIQKFTAVDTAQNINNDRERAVKFIGSVSDNIIERIRSIL